MISNINWLPQIPYGTSEYNFFVDRTILLCAFILLKRIPLFIANNSNKTQIYLSIFNAIFVWNNCISVECFYSVKPRENYRLRNFYYANNSNSTRFSMENRGNKFIGTKSASHSNSLKSIKIMIFDLHLAILCIIYTSFICTNNMIPGFE